MQGKETRHLRAFLEFKLKPEEQVLGFLEGWIGEVMGTGDKTQRNGQFVLTNSRVCFYRAGFFGEVFETIPLSKITSVETFSRLGYRVLRLHTSHDQLAFKTFESSKLFDQVYDLLEAARHPESQAKRQVPQQERCEIECPYCAEMILKKAKVCKHCGRDVASDTAIDQQPTERNIDTTKPLIRVFCPCGARIKARQHLAGKNVRCPTCNSPLQLPQA